MHDAENDWLFTTITDIEKNIHQEEIKEKLSFYLKNEMPNLISDENFYCKMFVKKETRFVLLERIHKLFPEAKILLGTRNKKDLLISWYKQYIAVGGSLQFDDFIDKILNLNNLNYEEYVKRLADFYGDNNVYIYKFENLIKEHEKTIKEICGFIGCSIPKYRLIRRNVGFGEKEIKASLLLNKIFKNEVHNRGIIYPYKFFFLPHRYLFQSKIYSPFLKEKIELDALIKKDETKRLIENVFTERR